MCHLRQPVHKSSGASRCSVLLPIALSILCGQDLGAEVRIPSSPPDKSFVADYARVLDPKAYTRLGQTQKTAFEQHGTPIIVAVIYRRADYGGGGISLEDFAKQWFNVWKIGTLDAGDKGANKGILLLVSIGDREARIELGAQWNDKWNAECERIMQQAIIPEFKQGRYSEGICRGVEELARMAGQDPAGPPPRELFGQIRDTANQYVREPLQSNGNPWAWGWSALLIGGGIVLLLVGVVTQRKPFIWAGVILLLLGISWIALALLAAARSKAGRGSGSGGGSFGGSFGGYSGGGFSGGFSRGGGASGRW